MKHLYLFLFLAFFLISKFSFGQFGPQNIIEDIETDNPRCTYAFDIDGDNDNDLLSASIDDGKICWYENVDGHGNFGPQQIIADSIYMFVYASDMDGDNDLDVIAGGDNLVWYENIDGYGTFSTMHIIYSFGSLSINLVQASDFDGDGDNDVITLESNKLQWWENDGLGAFASAQVIDYSSNIWEFYVFDLDGDGDNDILSAHGPYDKICWYENTDGLGAFGIQQIIASSVNYANGVYASDIDGDNDLDIIFSSWWDDKIMWCENIDNLGTFGPAQVISLTTTLVGCVFACDIDNDGDKDIVSGQDISYNSLVWFENDGGGNFGPMQVISDSYDGIKFIYGSDLNGDNSIDIISVDPYSDKISWHNNNGDGTFGSEKPITNAIHGAWSVISSDLDGDGDQDVISASNTDHKICWYNNLDGLGSFGNQQIITNLALGAKSVTTCDLDFDGDNDVVFASPTDNRIYWANNIDGLGNFISQIITSGAVEVKSVYPCDIDNDGDIDILSTSLNSIIWYEAAIVPGYYPYTHIITDSANSASSVYACDIDNDGDLDVLSASENDNKICWYNNLDGLGSFGNQQIITNLALGAKSVYACDIDGDNDMDVLSASASDNKICWYNNMDGLGGFGNQQIITTSAYIATSVYAVDIDNDGDTDVLSASYNDNKIAWYENLNGLGSFGSQQIITTQTIGANSVYASDLDCDGDYDLLSASFTDSKICWYENHTLSPYKIKGKCFLDENRNGQKDSLESGLGFIQTVLSPNELASFSNSTGEFWFATDTGAYLLTFITNNINYWALTTDSTEYHIVLSDSVPIVDSLLFGFYPDSIFTDISLSLTSGQQRCNLDVSHWINYINIGTTMPVGVIELILDDSLTFVSSAMVPDSIIGQYIYWNFDTLNYFTEGMIPLVVQMPDFNSMGDTLASVINIYTDDSTGTYMFSDTLCDVLICSFDPNDKLVSPTGTGLEGIISKDEILEYTVRFQNTGNDTAINVKIRDQIDPNLDISSIQLLGTSHHPVDVYIEQNRWLVFQFDSIMLPDSTTNFLESQGFVKYRMAIDSTVLPNTQILNTANIFFDCNPAVITNTVLNTIECYISPLAPDIYLSDTLLIANTTDNIQWYLNDTILIGATDSAYYPLVDGNYTVLVTDSNGCSAFSDVYIYNTVSISETEQGLIINVYPNPFKDYTTVEFSESLKGEHDFIIYNLLGSEVKRYSAIKSNKLQVQKSGLINGIYLGKLINTKQKTEEGKIKLVIE